MKEILIGFCLAIALVNIVNFIMVWADTDEDVIRIVNAPIAFGIFYVIKKIVLFFEYCYCPCVFVAYWHGKKNYKQLFIITKNIWQFMAVKKRLSKEPWKKSFFYSKNVRPDDYEEVVSGKYKNIIYA